MTTPNAKLLGKYLVVDWLPDGGTAPDDLVTLTVYSRNFALKQASKDIDVTVRQDVLDNTEDILAGVPTRDVTISGLDSDEDTPDWDQIEIGDSGTLTWYRRGKASGKPRKSMTARCTGGGDLTSPHDNANDWSLTFKGTSAITTDVVPGP